MLNRAGQKSSHTEIPSNALMQSVVYLNCKLGRATVLLADEVLCTSLEVVKDILLVSQRASFPPVNTILAATSAENVWLYIITLPCMIENEAVEPSTTKQKQNSVW